MTRDIIDIQDFTVLLEVNTSEEPALDVCSFEEPAIGIAFYGSGDVDLTVHYEGQQKEYKHTKGLAMSFYADEKVEFAHLVSPEKPLQCIVIVTAVRQLESLPHQEGEIFSQLLSELVHPSGPYVEGPRFLMNPDMAQAVDKIFNLEYQGKTKMMLFRSKIIELLSHFFGELATSKEEQFKDADRQKLLEAKDILLKRIESPPSLNELSRLIGLNSYKLKKSFKELFGVPVFKYLQNERLTKAYDLLKDQGLSTQEAAWHVGYDSLGSFSNAFEKKFGFRPSEVKR
ncbi:MAG: AraC family transcriptional regulator [Bacteroidota bacterium]